MKFKPRTSRHPEFVPNGVRLNRTYDDYQVCLDEHPGSNVVEMDAVIGRIGGKVIMTLQFVNVDFVFGLLLEKIRCGGGREDFRSEKNLQNTLSLLVMFSPFYGYVQDFLYEKRGVLFRNASLRLLAKSASCQLSNRVKQESFRKFPRLHASSAC